ncbi:hypothetical protein F5050DRAFT_1715162 [Lentinula boryana]|uniref:Uncharacterized protein n=1 Tax=Lentinula boryana TaxID=40481 RepID=A0ABQ8Q419_9AGAR|nr:hypothetical protein F5050DRAFT_1715162 [Lentinula boryana]
MVGRRKQSLDWIVFFISRTAIIFSIACLPIRHLNTIPARKYLILRAVATNYAGIGVWSNSFDAQLDSLLLKIAILEGVANSDIQNGTTWKPWMLLRTSLPHAYHQDTTPKLYNALKSHYEPLGTRTPSRTSGQQLVPDRSLLLIHPFIVLSDITAGAGSVVGDAASLSLRAQFDTDSNTSLNLAQSSTDGLGDSANNSASSSVTVAGPCLASFVLVGGVVVGSLMVLSRDPSSYYNADLSHDVLQSTWSEQKN